MKKGVEKYGSQKFEIRSTNVETNSNDQNSKLETTSVRNYGLQVRWSHTRAISFWSFCHWNFEFVSDFEIRISDLGLHALWVYIKAGRNWITEKTDRVLPCGV